MMSTLLKLGLSGYDDILPNTSCIIGNLFESSEADGNSADTEGTSQNESQPESRECKNRRTARHVKRVDYRALSLAPQNAGQKRDKSESGSKLEGITTLRNKLASTTKIKDTIAATLDNTRKELATTTTGVHKRRTDPDKKDARRI